MLSCQTLCSFHYYVKLGFSSQHKICLDDAAIVSHMFTSHSINFIPRTPLHRYDEIRQLLSVHVLFIAGEAIINGETRTKNPMRTLRRNKNANSNLYIKNSRYPLIVQMKEKIIQNLTITLNLLDKLQHGLDKAVNEKLEPFFNLGVNYLHSEIRKTSNQRAI